MQTISEVRRKGLACFPCNSDKTPIVKKGQHWSLAATILETQSYTAIGGIPVPEGVLIIDLDLYEGITREEAAIALKCTIPWSQSLIQTTMRGGEHHAFKIDFESTQKASNPIKGFDTRVGGKGYICFGKGYTPVGRGVLRLLDIASLPKLPIEARGVLETVKYIDASIDNVTVNIGVDDLRNALVYIDPWCNRDQWLHVGMALKHQFGNDPLGFELFNKWSRGDFHNKDGIPNNYVEKTQYHQWQSFQLDGTRTIDTIYYMARQGGWVSISKIAEALGLSTPLLPFISSRIVAEITDVEAIPYCQLELQPKQHRVSAEIIINEWLTKRVLIIGGILRWWSGAEWQQFCKDVFENFLWGSLPLKMDNVTIFNGIKRAFLVAVTRCSHATPCKRIFFRNEILDLTRGEVVEHNKDNLNCGTLTVDNNVLLSIDKWEKFLVSIFGDIKDPRVMLLQEIFGWCLITHNLGIEKYIAFSGVPRAGKGTVLKVLMELLGDEFCNSVNFNTLGSPHTHETLRKYNVVIDLDAKIPPVQDRAEAAATLLKLTANESISSRQFYTTESIYGPMNCKFLIACNKIPNLLDDSGAAATRVVALLFDKSFHNNEQYGLFDQLLTELSGIATWAVQGLERLLKNDSRFTEPISSLEIQNDLKSTSQPLGEFVEEHIVLEPDARCFNYQLYDIFKRYCDDTGCNRMNSIVFIKALKVTLLGKNVKWSEIRINNERKKGVIGIRIDNPLRIFISAPLSL